MNSNVSNHRALVEHIRKRLRERGWSDWPVCSICGRQTPPEDIRGGRCVACRRPEREE